MIAPHNYQLGLTVTGCTLSEIGSEISLVITELEYADIGKQMLRQRKRDEADEQERLRYERDGGAS